MSKIESPADSGKTIALVAPVPPPNGGMSMQAQKLRDRLGAEGLCVIFIPTNPDFPGFLKWCAGIPGVRTFVRFWIYLPHLFGIRHADVVHVFASSHLYFFISVVPALVIGKVFGKRVIVNYRGGEAESFFNSWGRFAKPFFRFADEVVVPSEFLQDVFRRKLSLETEILPNIADTEVFTYRERDEFRPILVVARQLEPIYGHETILKAFTRIQETFPEASLQIAGSGSCYETLVSRVEALGLSGVDFLGTLSHRQLAEVYQSCDIMLNASTADNFPGALIEAFLCGLPIVTTDAGGIPLMVEDQVNGLLVKPGDDQALAEAVTHLVRSPQHGRQIAENGRRYAQAYQWSEIRRKIFRYYFPADEQGGEYV